MKHLLPGLLIPAVLAGCVSHSASTDAPASIYIDGLIADSAQTISQAQTGLHQTGPNPARPVSPTALIKPLPPSTPVRPGVIEPYRSPSLPVSQNVQQRAPGTFIIPATRWLRPEHYRSGCRTTHHSCRLVSQLVPGSGKSAPATGEPVS